MPHINRIRVNNVKYNFGTQYYDDFILRFSGKNTIYDLANGGGKSVLMLLLLQNMIPNCTLDEKQPIEKLFRTSGGSQTIHSLVEWKLNGNDIKDGFRYMTTGFCARKARENNEEENTGENAAIDYFNYVIFYREFNDNDIKNLPLNNGKERITYQGLKDYLRSLSKHDYSLKVYLFERKGDYQRFVSQYGIYESEWEIIRGINKTEGHVRTYFESNFRTTRKVVEDLLIEEIIRKSYQNHTGEGEDFADVLMDIKDKLLELNKKKNEMNYYDHQAEILRSFMERLGSLKGLYHQKDSLEQDLKDIYERCLAKIEKNNEEKELAVSEKKGLAEERIRTMAKVESAAIQLEEEELAILDSQVKEIKNRLLDHESQLKEGEERLLLKENANDYFEYIENGKAYEAARTAVEELRRENSDLLSELEELSRQAKVRIEEKLYTLTELTEEQQKECDTLTEQEKQARERITDNERQIVTANSEKDVLEKENKQILLLLEELQKQAGLLLLDQAGEEKEKRSLLLENSREELDRIKSAIREISRKKADIQVALSECTLEKKQLEKNEKSIEGNIQKGLAEKASLDKLCEIYGETDYRKLADMIHSLCRHNIENAREKKQEAERKAARLQAYEEGKLFPAEDSLEEICRYIQRTYDGSAITGMEYLSALSLEERKEWYEKLPMLAHAILVREGYEEIVNDTTIRQKYMGSSAVIIMKQDALEECCEEVTSDWYAFLTGDSMVFLAEEDVQAKLMKLREEIAALEKQQDNLLDREMVMQKDMERLSHFLHFYPLEDMEKECEEIKVLLQKCEERKAKIIEELANAEREEEGLQSRLEQMYEKQQNLSEEIRFLSEIEGKYIRYNENSNRENELRTELSMLEKAKEEIKEAWNVTAKRLSDKKEKLETLQQEKQKLVELWNGVYHNYYKEGEAVEPIPDFDTIHSQFLGKKEAFEQENADVEDKKKLMESYRQSMEKNAESIRYRGGNIDELAFFHQSHMIRKTPVEQLLQFKEELVGLKDHILVDKNQLEVLSEQANRKFGAISHGKTQIEEKYGAYEVSALSGDKLRQYQKEYSNVVKDMEKKLAEADKQMKQLEEDSFVLQAMEENTSGMLKDAMVEPEGLQPCDSVYTLQELKAQYEALKEQFKKLQKEEYRKREEFEKDKQKLRETLMKTQAYALAEEIERSILPPEKEEDVDRQLENLEHTIACIGLEKDSISKGIADMEKLKANFESHCLQTCMNIKTALDRLPQLSKIRLDDKMISVVMLQIPYIKEEMYQDAMSNYIDDIIKASDRMTDANEQVKYIRQQLTWKRLFSVIVTDMNAIRLHLYKRERMKEQSRYLRYEEAVGSTGQSQGIYIQFLISVINYISSMNSSNADPMQLKKVIFIDNPFGAAKDVYIWEPIFKLLRANNVQLIVPARGATPAITGRFEVNYILGQKLIDSKLQTVVVDYRSQIEEDEVEYTALTYEQASFTF